MYPWCHLCDAENSTDAPTPLQYKKVLHNARAFRFSAVPLFVPYLKKSKRKDGSVVADMKPRSPKAQSRLSCRLG